MANQQTSIIKWTRRVPGSHAIPLSRREVGTVQLRSRQICLVEMGASETGEAEIGVDQHRADQFRAARPA